MGRVKGGVKPKDLTSLSPSAEASGDISPFHAIGRSASGGKWGEYCTALHLLLRMTRCASSLDNFVAGITVVKPAGSFKFALLYQNGEILAGVVVPAFQL